MILPLAQGGQVRAANKIDIFGDIGSGSWSGGCDNHRLRREFGESGG
jgi:hypothetical protein